MTTMMTTRQYPIGIQTFSEMIRGRYVYVDKTDLVWQLAHYVLPYQSEGRKVVKFNPNTRVPEERVIG